MGFDQMMLFYNHFCVIKSNIKVVFRQLSAQKAQVSLRQDASSTPITVIDRIIEMGGNQLEWLEASGIQGDQKTLELSIDVPRLQGITWQTALSDPTLRGDAATSPTEVSYFHLQAWDSGAASSSIVADVVLEQIAYFMEPRNQIES